MPDTTPLQGEPAEVTQDNVQEIVDAVGVDEVSIGDVEDEARRHRDATQLGHSIGSVQARHLSTELRSVYEEYLSWKEEVLNLAGLSRGLIGRWPLDDGSGATATDESEYGNDGTLEGTDPVWTSGLSGSCVSFPGTDERVDCGNGAPLDDLGNGSFSLSFWMKSKDAVPLSNGRLFSKQVGTKIIFLRSSGVTNKLYFQMADGVVQVYGDFNAAPFDTNWNHIVLVVNRATDLALCYFNNVKDEVEFDLSTLVADCSNTDNVSWGAWSDGVQPYEGLLDELRIYDRALTEDEIGYLYKYPTGEIPAYVPSGWGEWHKIADPGTGWLASETAWAAGVDNFDNGLEVDFKPLVPTGTRAVLVSMPVEVATNSVYCRKSGDANISNTPDASQEYSHRLAYMGRPQVVVWLSSDYKAQFTVTNATTDLYIAYPIGYML